MKIIVTEKRLLENSYDIKHSEYLLPQFLFQNLKTHKTSLGDNVCFPIEGKYPFDYKLIKDRYKEVVDSVKEITELTSLDIDTVKTYCNKLLQECINIEKPIRDLLNDICRKTVKKILCVPEETVIFQCHLTDKVEPKHSPRIMPEDDSSAMYEFDDVDDMVLSNDTILKRRFINSLIQGASYELSNHDEEYMDEIYKLDSSLPTLYKKIRILNNYILFNEKDVIDEKHFNQGAYVDVNLGKMGNKTKIESQAIIFPYLLTESIRGFFELFASHSLPDDNAKAMYIIQHADFVMAESWDLRFGVSLWKAISEGVKDNLLIPYFFTELVTLPLEEFNKEVKEILSNTKHGKQFKQELIDKCGRSITFNDLPQDFSDENIKSIIADETENDEFTLDELKNMKL